MPFTKFDRSRLRLQPLGERTHDIDRSTMIYPNHPHARFHHDALPKLAERLVCAARTGRAAMLCCGAHVIRAGVGPLIADLMRWHLINHVALNGAGAIHDFELAMIGQTCESVGRYIRSGEFGLWNETGRMNDAVAAGHREGLGMGEAIGRMIEREDFPYRDTSVLAAGVRYGVPVTVHVGIGQDILHEHPNFDAAATGAASYEDFLIFTQTVSKLEGGVFINAGTAVMGPEVYLKALAMARNVAHQQGEVIRNFTTAVFDLPDLGHNFQAEFKKTDPRYFFRPYKTVLLRTVADGGTSYYVQGDHRQTIPALYDAIVREADERRV